MGIVLEDPCVLGCVAILEADPEDCDRKVWTSYTSLFLQGAISQVGTTLSCMDTRHEETLGPYGLFEMLRWQWLCLEVVG